MARSCVYETEVREEKGRCGEEGKVREEKGRCLGKNLRLNVPLKFASHNELAS